MQIRSHQYAAEATVRTFNGKEWIVRKQPAGRVYGYQVETANKAPKDSGEIFDEGRRAGCIILRPGH